MDAPNAPSPDVAAWPLGVRVVIAVLAGAAFLAVVWWLTATPTPPAAAPGPEPPASRHSMPPIWLEQDDSHDSNVAGLRAAEGRASSLPAHERGSAGSGFRYGGPATREGPGPREYRYR